MNFASERLLVYEREMHPRLLQLALLQSLVFLVLQMVWLIFLVFWDLVMEMMGLKEVRMVHC